MSYFFQSSGFAFLSRAPPIPDWSTYDTFTSYVDQTGVDAVYVPLDTKISGDTTNDRLNFHTVADGSNDACYRSLGGTASDTAWVLRFQYSMTAQDRSGGGAEAFPVIGLSDSGSSRDEDVQDGIAFNPYQDNLTRSYHISYADGHRLAGDRGSGSTRVTSFSELATVGDNYYIQLRRTSSTVADAKIYSDVYSTLVESKSLTISSGVTSLEYFVVKNGSSLGVSTPYQTGWLDNIGFQDGVTTWV